LELAVIEICLPSYVKTPTFAEASVGKSEGEPAITASRINMTSASSIKTQVAHSPINQINPTPTPVSPSVNLQPMPADFNVVAILSRWEEVLAKVKTNNHSLSFILRACQVKDLKGNQLCLAFKYKFHKDRVSEPSIRMLIEKIISEVYNTNIILETVIDGNLEMVANISPVAEVKSSSAKALEDKKVMDGEDNKSVAGSDSMIDNLLKTFGGKIIG
jgi:hypothetical protein